MTSKSNCFTGYVASNQSIEITVPTMSDPVVVMSVFDWIIIHQHLGKDFDWNRTWDEYKAGFGSIDENFWFGLEKMHLLTKCKRYRLRVEMQDRESNLWYSAEYWSFKIGDELNDKYRLNVSGYSGDAGDALQHEGDSDGNRAYGYYLHNGMMFTTYDRDNDMQVNFPYNCALPRAGGWWFNRCEWCCLTCWWKKHTWEFLPSAKTRIAVSRMMIKPQ